MITTNYPKKNFFFLLTSKMWGFPGGSVVKMPPANAGDVGSIPGLGRPSEEGNDNLLQYSCLGNPKLKGAWRGYGPWGRKRVGHDLGTKQQQN